ncbi:MAG: radical SAM protein [Candidatus Omnitrophota bacterium]
MDIPNYITAFKSKELHIKAETAWKKMKSCSLCPRMCAVNRLADETGFCKTGKDAILCSYFGHHGEEPPISGTQGSGTLFFSRCNMHCLYCQNYNFSQLEEGRPTTIQQLADYMLKLQDDGCHNINLVTPTHNIAQILKALILGIENGLSIPLVYNTSGYELPETIRLLDGVIDIYLTDARYADNQSAIQYSNAPNYPHYNQESIKEMYKQVGLLRLDKNGIATKGLIIRHLVLPENIAGTEKIFSFISKEISPRATISLMSQYFPTFKANNNPPLNRHITAEEYEDAILLLKKYGLNQGWIQESGGLKRFAGTNIKRNV